MTNQINESRPSGETARFIFMKELCSFLVGSDWLCTDDCTACQKLSPLLTPLALFFSVNLNKDAICSFFV